MGYFGLIALEDELSAFFGRRVDLLTEGGLSPFIRDNVLRSARVLFHDAA
jgi:predicted nucleotidyltransferase